MESSDVIMVFGGIWKERYKSGSSIRPIGGICASLAYLQHVLRARSHASRPKTQVGSVTDAGPVSSGKSFPVAGMLSMHGTNQLISKVSRHLQVKHFRKDNEWGVSKVPSHSNNSYDIRLLRDKNPISNDGFHHCPSGFTGVFSICRCLSPPLTVILTSSS